MGTVLFKLLRSKIMITLLMAVLVLLFAVSFTGISAYAQTTVLFQPRTAPGDLYPLNPASWPPGSTAVYASPWDDVNSNGGSGVFSQTIAENFVLGMSADITEIIIWGGYWHRSIPPASDSFTVIFYNDSGGAVGTEIVSFGPDDVLSNRVPQMLGIPQNATSTAIFAQCNAESPLVNPTVVQEYIRSRARTCEYQYTLTFPSPVSLDPGTYWVAIYNDTTGHYNANDFFWRWAHVDPVNGIDGLAWKNSNVAECSTDWCIDTGGNVAIEIIAEVAVEVAFDIKPRSCPNPLNTNKKGVLPTAINGTDDFDVTTIDPETIQLEGVSPLRWSWEDVSTAFEPFTGKEDAYDCSEEDPDGYLDLALKFKSREIVSAIETLLGRQPEDRETVVLSFTGNLLEEFGGTAITGEDVVIILKKK